MLACGEWREADERPEPRSLGLLPSGPDPVGEWFVHRQPPGPLYLPPLPRKQATHRARNPGAAILSHELHHCCWHATVAGASE